MSQRIIIIGAGQSGAQAVATLRSEGFAGSITMIGDEAFAPYQRPPLSKTYLMGTMERERLFLKPDAFYQDAKCELMLGVTAVRCHRADKTVTLSDGSTLKYDKLLLATGSRVRKMRVPGANLAGIHYLRSIADVDALRAVFNPQIRLAIVGGGYIGLEVAAVAVKRKIEVTVFEAMDRLMARTVSVPVSDFYARVHREAGVNLLLNTAVEAFEGSQRLEAIRANGVSYRADVALVGIGVLPNQEIAQEAGLGCDDGIVVDDKSNVTGDPSIFAAGDCTKHIGREGNALRLESVQNAIDQAKHAALCIVGKPSVYREVPWFWSDQYDLKLQIAGLRRASDKLVVRGRFETGKFAVFHLREGAIGAVEAINAAPEYLMGRKLISQGTKVLPEQIADTSIPMKSIV